MGCIILVGGGGALGYRTAQSIITNLNCYKVHNGYKAFLSLAALASSVAIAHAHDIVHVLVQLAL